MNTLLNKTRCAAKRGFTLIEIMVATVIMVVLVGLVIQITSEVLKVWTRSSGKLSANAEARIAMDFITQDLETAVFRNNRQQWLRVDAPLPGGGLYSGQTVGLKLFSPALDRPKEDDLGVAIPGDICAIGYRLDYRESYPRGPKMYALYRMIVNPRSTFESYLGSKSDASSPQVSLADGLWSDSNITIDKNYLVSNIVGFKILVYELDPVTGQSVLINGDITDGELTVDYAYGGDSVSDLAVSTNKLLYADVILTVLSDKGLELLDNIEKLPDTVDQVVEQHGETFTRRVNFMAHPL